MAYGRAIDRLTIRAVTFVGLAATVALWMYAGYQFTRRMTDVERQSGALDKRYMHAQELLSTVRAQTLIASVYVRDALLDPRQEERDQQDGDADHEGARHDRKDGEPLRHRRPGRRTTRTGHRPMLCRQTGSPAER